jgi:hypothetical protein
MAGTGKEYVGFTRPIRYIQFWIEHIQLLINPSIIAQTAN